MIDSIDAEELTRLRDEIRDVEDEIAAKERLASALRQRHNDMMKAALRRGRRL